MVLTVCGLLVSIAIRSWFLPIAFGFISLMVLVLAGIHPRLISRRLRPIFYMATLTGVTQIFFYGQNPWFEWDFGFFRLIGYREGLDQGILLASRIFGGMSVMLFLTLSTSVQELVRVLAWLKIPPSIIEIMTMAYSSLFVLLEELDRIQMAQRMRLGYGSWWQTVRAASTVGGILFIRVFDKSQRLWQSMQCRGYDGEVSANMRKLAGKEILLMALGFLAILGTWIFGR